MTMNRTTYLAVAVILVPGAAFASNQISAAALGISFVSGSNSTFRIRRDGRTYLVDLAAHTVREQDPAPAPAQTSDQAGSGAAIFAQHCAECHGANGQGVGGLRTPDFTNPQVQAAMSDSQMLATIRQGKPGTLMPAWSGKLTDAEILAVVGYLRSLSTNAPTEEPSQTASKRNVYTPGDDRLMTLPSGRPIQDHGLYVNFAHRFAYDPAFSGVARGGALFGLDGFSLSSFGLRYGVTKNFQVDAYREPTFIGRPIQLAAQYNFLSEFNGAPLNFAAAFAIQGQNDFQINFAESFEFILSRSITHRAQLYFVPTFTANARRLFSPASYESSAIPHLPGYSTFSTGIGGAFDIRPTVALIAEVIPTLLNGAPLGINRPSYSFGIQKKIWRHAFTFGFTDAPGTTVSEQADTRAAFLNQPGADKFKDLFIGFDITRQLF